MSISPNEKMLGAHIDSALVDEFSNQVDERGYKSKRCLGAMVKLWLSLPEVVQAKLLNQSLDADSFIELVQGIVDERIEAGRKTARKSLEPPRKKRSRKG